MAYNQSLDSLRAVLLAAAGASYAYLDTLSLWRKVLERAGYSGTLEDMLAQYALDTKISVTQVYEITAEQGLNPAVAAQATHYVSNSATNGYAAGADSGAGTTKAAPWATLTFALANAPTGSVIEINDGTYQGATFYNVNDKTITIQCRRIGGVTLQAADAQTRVVNLNLAATSRTVVLNNLVLDGRNNTTRGISAGGAGVALGVVAGITTRNCTFKDCTTRYIDFPQQKSIALNVISCSGTGSMGGRPIFAQDAQDGSFTINGFNFATTMATTGTAGVEMNRAAGSTGVTVSISGVTGTLTASAIGIMNGIVVRNQTAPTLQGNSLTLSGASNTSGALYKVFSDSATLDANNAVIRGNGGAHNGEGGYCILVGTDATGAGNNMHNNALVENNNISANAIAANAIHGYMLGFGTGGTVQNNTLTGGGHALLAKDQTGATFDNNTIDGFTADGMYSKGSSNVTFSDNTVTVSVANANGTLRIGQDEASLAHSTGIVATGNIYNVNENPPKIVEVATGSDATFTANRYNINATLGTSPSPWGYQGIGYNTLAAWKAAVEPTALP